MHGCAPAQCGLVAGCCPWVPALLKSQTLCEPQCSKHTMTHKCVKPPHCRTCCPAAPTHLLLLEPQKPAGTDFYDMHTCSSAALPHLLLCSSDTPVTPTNPNPAGTDFYDVYTGVGARRIRETFEMLRNFAPAVLFIDEFDALGAARGAAAAGDESASIINEMLVQVGEGAGCNCWLLLSGSLLCCGCETQPLHGQFN